MTAAQPRHRANDPCRTIPHISQRPLKDGLFGAAAFDIEHAIGMYATSYCTIPAEGIYERDRLEPLKSVLENCHIYLIGYTPRVDLVRAEQRQQVLELHFEILGSHYSISYDLPRELALTRTGEEYILQNSAGERFWPMCSKCNHVCARKPTPLVLRLST